MPITWTITRRDLRSFPTAGGSVTFSVSVGARGPKGDDGADDADGQNSLSSIDDSTDLGTLTNAVADALSLLATNSAGTKARRVALAAIHRAILAAADAAGVRSAIGAGTGNGDALTTGTLGQFAATTSAQLAGVLTDETGSGGGFVRADSPALAGTVSVVNLTASGTTFNVANAITVGSLGSYSTLYGSNARFASNALVTWSSVLNNPISANADTALSRNSAGVVEINNGTAGTLRDLTLRNLTASGTVTISSGASQIPLTLTAADTTKTSLFLRSSTNADADWEWQVLGSGISGRVGNMTFRNNNRNVSPFEVTPLGETNIFNLSIRPNISSANRLELVNAASHDRIQSYNARGIALNPLGNGVGVGGSPTSGVALAVTGSVTVSTTTTLGVYTVATLPSASANAGALAQVTDSSVTTNGSTVAGGGANRVPVFSNGTNWIVK